MKLYVSHGPVSSMSWGITKKSITNLLWIELTDQRGAHTDLLSLLSYELVSIQVSGQVKNYLSLRWVKSR